MAAELWAGRGQPGFGSSGRAFVCRHRGGRTCPEKRLKGGGEGRLYVFVLLSPLSPLSLCVLSSHRFPPAAGKSISLPTLRPVLHTGSLTRCPGSPELRVSRFSFLSLFGCHGSALPPHLLPVARVWGGHGRLVLCIRNGFCTRGRWAQPQVCPRRSGSAWTPLSDIGFGFWVVTCGVRSWTL